MSFEWAPVVTGSAAIIGGVVTQALNVWRDKIQSKKSDAKDAAKLAHDDLIDWRKTRLDSYTTLSNSLDAVHMAVGRTGRAETLSDLVKGGEAVDSASKDIPLLVARVEMIASTSTKAAARSCYIAVLNARVVCSFIETHELIEQDIDIEEEKIKINNVTSKLTRLIADLQNCFREDLGLPKQGI